MTNNRFVSRRSATNARPGNPGKDKAARIQRSQRERQAAWLIAAASFLFIGVWIVAFFAIYPVAAQIGTSFSLGAPQHEIRAVINLSATLSVTPVLMETGTPTQTATPMISSTTTATFTPSATATATLTPTETPTEQDTPTPLPTDTPEPIPPTAALPAPVAKSSSSSGGVKWIEVDLSDQMLYAWEGKTQVASFIVSTGAAPYRTITGSYPIYEKHRKANMWGPGYFFPDVPYTMYFHKGYGIHGTYWHNNFGTPMSHGCVNMSIPDAEWLYYWAPIGTSVKVHH